MASEGASPSRESGRIAWGMQKRDFLSAVLLTAILAAPSVTCRHVDISEADTQLPSRQSSKEKMHIVIAVHKEPLEEVKAYFTEILALPNIKRMQPHVYAYVKGGAEQAAAMREAEFVDEVVEAPNTGRESESYMRHIIAHYDNLPAHVFFTQALPQYDYSVALLGTHFGDKTGVLGISGVSVCTCEGFSAYFRGVPAEHGGFIRIRELWALFQETFCPKEFACSHNGMFVVSRQRIIAQPKKLYEYVQSLFFLSRDHPLRHHDGNYLSYDDDMPASESGWFTLGHNMERSWFFVFNCTDPSVSNNCSDPCPDNLEDCIGVPQCQCLDD